MIRFLKRHSVDLTRRNSKGEEQDKDKEREREGEQQQTNEVNGALQDGALQKDRSGDEMATVPLDKVTKEESGIVTGEDIIDESVKHEKVEDQSEINPCKGLSFSVGVSENRNSKYRRTMEDVHTYVANFCERLDWGYFGVFDGHAGKQTARWAGTNLHNLLYESIMNDKFTDLRENLNSSFLEADKEIAKMKGVGSSGSTAAVAVLRWEEEVDEEGEDASPQHETKGSHTEAAGRLGQDAPFDFIPTKKHKRILYTANVGDTRIVISRRGRAKRLCYEHKGSDKSEIKRIYKNGGLVLGGRVNGVLAVSRSLGDIYLKEYVLGAPYTTMTEVNDGDEFLIIACDGLWDVCDDQEAVDLIKNVTDAKAASETLCDYAIRNGTCDNVTVMVVMLDTRIFGYSEAGPA